MKTATVISIATAAAITLVSGLALAQHRPGGRPSGPPPGPPPGMRGTTGIDSADAVMEHGILKYLYPIEMVRRHSSELELTDKQVEKLRKVIIDVQTEVEQLKWDLNGASRKLTKIIRDGGTKEQIYAQMDVVFKFENKIKKKHLGLLVVIRDVLSAKQKKILDDIKARHQKQGLPNF